MMNKRMKMMKNVSGKKNQLIMKKLFVVVKAIMMKKI